jgi:aconitate hydratase
MHFPSGDVMPIYDAAERYRSEGVPLVVVAGKEYGSGSSRDWAAKGTLLLGVRAVLAESFERIHRSNLVGMGILPLQFKPGESAETFGITGRETLTIVGVSGDWLPRQDVTIDMVRPDATRTAFVVTARLDTPVEINYYRNGGILRTVLRKMLKA